MKGKPYLYAGAVTLTLAAALGLSVSITQADGNKKLKVPTLQVDTTWPKMPLPVAGQFGTALKVSTANGKPLPWVTGEVAGTCVDSRDHVFTVNRGVLISPEAGYCAAQVGCGRSGARIGPAKDGYLTSAFLAAASSSVQPSRGRRKRNL